MVSDGSTRAGWADEDNARRYDAYARQYPMYRQTSRVLVALARLSGSSVVVDLACGTGIATEEVLAMLGPAGRVIGVDKSAAMLEVAAAAITDPRASWVQASAESVDQHLAGNADAVVCNSAIWQTDFAATSTALRNVLTAGGRFVFNWPAGFFDQHRPADERPTLASVMRAIAADDYGWTMQATSAPATSARPRHSRESIGRCLREAGFTVELVEEQTYEDSAESRRAWYSIPIFTQQYLPGLPYQDRLRVLDQAYDRLGPAEAVVEQWLAFVAIAT
jgi:trans-aconitate methyltransferase